MWEYLRGRGRKDQRGKYKLWGKERTSVCVSWVSLKGEDLQTCNRGTCTPKDAQWGREKKELGEGGSIPEKVHHRGKENQHIRIERKNTTEEEEHMKGNENVSGERSPRYEGENTVQSINGWGLQIQRSGRAGGRDADLKKE